jgi:hypothetical protein
MLDKNGQFDVGGVHRVNLLQNLGSFTIVASPHILIAGLCLLCRHNPRLVMAGLFAAVVTFGSTLWGNLTDYLHWSRLMPPNDQVTYLATGFALLGNWCVCAIFVLFSLASRYLKFEPRPDLGSGRWSEICS